VRVQVDSNRQYFLHTLPTTSGILRLERPYEYRHDKRFPVKVGVALGLPLRTRRYSSDWNYRAEPMFVAGVGVEDYLDDDRVVGAWELAIDYHLGRMGYRGVGLQADQGGNPNRLTFVWYHRVAAKLGYTWWGWQRVHLGGAFGGGVGRSLWLRDTERTDGYNSYFAFEAWVRYTPGKKTWIELAPELRTGEKRVYFETDFAGQPERIEIPSLDLSLELRVRFGGG
jgi:hypothetical protein